MFSKTVGYAIRGVLYLAAQSTENRNVGVAELSSELGVPKHFLGKILQSLARKELVISTKGPGGGFRAETAMLSKSIIDIVAAMDGMAFFDNCSLGLDKCNAEAPCVLHNRLVEPRNRLLEDLRRTSISDLLENSKLKHELL